MASQKSKELTEQLHNKTNKSLAPRKPATDFKSMLELYAPEIQKALPTMIGKNKKEAMERLVFLVVSEVKKNPKLLQCTPNSIISGFIQSTRLGLEIGGELAQAFLVPFRNKKTQTLEAQFIVGYQGYIELFYRSGKVKSVYADCVRENDEFSFKYGTNEHLSHRPSWEDDDRGAVTGAYAYAIMDNDACRFVAMSISELRVHKDKHSKVSFGPWTTDTDAMYKKTCIRLLKKFLPKSTEIEKLNTIDESTSPRLEELPVGTLDIPLIPENEIEGDGED